MAVPLTKQMVTICPNTCGTRKWSQNERISVRECSRSRSNASFSMGNRMSERLMVIAEGNSRTRMIFRMIIHWERRFEMSHDLAQRLTWLRDARVSITNRLNTSMKAEWKWYPGEQSISLENTWKRDNRNEKMFAKINSRNYQHFSFSIDGDQMIILFGQISLFHRTIELCNVKLYNFEVKLQKIKFNFKITVQKTL